MGVFVFSSLLNYLDRQLLPALAPVLRRHFALGHSHYGLVLSAFSLSYAAAAPLSGLFIDRVGLTCGISTAVGLWSLAGIATAFVRGLGSLVVCRTVLGVAQAGGVPATGKAIALYLEPRERALGNALSQIGLTAGAMLAPPLGVWLASAGDWRAAFLVTGLAGFLWIPLWHRVSRAALVRPDGSASSARLTGMLAERRLWTLVAANVLSMTVYTLWSNWTTLYLVETHGMRFEQTAWAAALPPLAANLGGLAGGFVSLLWMKRGATAVTARLRVCRLAAWILLGTALIPLAPNALLATVAISLSSFFSSAWSVNLYTLPLDIYGQARAAFATSLLTGAYGAMQAGVSPVYGALADRYGFAPLCILVSFCPLAGWGLLRMARLERDR